MAHSDVDIKLFSSVPATVKQREAKPETETANSEATKGTKNVKKKSISELDRLVEFLTIEELFCIYQLKLKFLYVAINIERLMMRLYQLYVCVALKLGIFVYWDFVGKAICLTWEWKDFNGFDVATGPIQTMPSCHTCWFEAYSLIWVEFALTQENSHSGTFRNES